MSEEAAALVGPVDGKFSFKKRLDGSVDKSMVVCKLCNKEFAYHRSTSSLKYHLHAKHRAASVYVSPSPSTQTKLNLASLKSADEASLASDVGSGSSQQTTERGQKSHQHEQSFQEEQETEAASRGQVNSDVQLQLVSLSKHSDSCMEPQREAFVSYIRASLKDLEEEVYDDLENDIYQIIRRHKQRDKQMKTSQMMPQVPPPPGQAPSSLQSSSQWQQNPHSWPQKSLPVVTSWHSQDPSLMPPLGQIKTENDESVKIYVL